MVEYLIIAANRELNYLYDRLLINESKAGYKPAFTSALI